MLLHSMWKSCASQKVESNQLHLCYNDIIIIATTNCSNCSTILSFYCYCKTDKNQKNPRWLATNECTIDEMKILYILPITTIMMLVMSRNKRTQKVLLSFKRFSNNIEAKKGAQKSLLFFAFCEKKDCALLAPFFFLLFDYRKVHNSLFKWTFLICALLKKTLRFISKPFLWKSTLLFFSLSSMQRN